jgi:hypothetical protein
MLRRARSVAAVAGWSTYANEIKCPLKGADYAEQDQSNEESATADESFA